MANPIGAFCREHKTEYRRWLNREMSNVFFSWNALIIATLGVVAVSYLNVAVHEDTALWFPYIPTVVALATYRIVHFFQPWIERYVFILADVLSLLFIAGILFVAQVIHLKGKPIANAPFQLGLFLAVIMGCYRLFWQNMVRAVVLSAILFLGIINAFPELARSFLMQVITGLIFGSIMHRFLMHGIKMRFYFHETNTESRRHAYAQLEKVVYQHQLEMVQSGYQLEETMPELSISRNPGRQYERGFSRRFRNPYWSSPSARLRQTRPNHWLLR